MKKWFFLTAIIAVLFICTYFVLTFYAVRFVQPRLQKMMGPGFTVEEIRLKPTYLSAKGIRYEDPNLKLKFFQVREIRIYPSLVSLFKKSIRIRELALLEPSFFFYRSGEGRLVGAWLTTGAEASGKVISEEKPKREGSVPFWMDRIRIQKGSIDFEDRKVGGPPVRIELRDMDFEIKDVGYPASGHSPVRLAAKMSGKEGEGSIRIEGWVDAKNMEMETSLKVREIEVKALEPYYRKRVTAEIECGTLDLESRVVVTKGRIDAPGQLGLINLQIKNRGGMVFWIPAETLVSFLEKRGHQLKATFCVKGNLENSPVSLQETFLTQVAMALARAVGMPVSVVDQEKGLTERSYEGVFGKNKEKRR